MIDQALLKELDEKFNIGISAFKPDDFLKLFELFRQIVEESKYGDNFDELDLGAQWNFGDKSYWFDIRDMKFEYGKGIYEYSSVEISEPYDKGIKILYDYANFRQIKEEFNASGEIFSLETFLDLIFSILPQIREEL